MMKQGILKTQDKDQVSSPSQQSSQKHNGNTPPHQESSQEKNQNPFEGGRGWGGPEDGSYAITEGGRGWGLVQETAHMSLTDMGESVQSSSSNEINKWGQ